MNKDMDNCLEELYLDLMFAVCSEKDNNDTITNVMASPPSKDVHVSAGCSTCQHVVKVWCLKLLTLTEETAALSQLSVCAPGCRVNKQDGAKWVRVEMGARPWPHANASSPVPHHHHHYCTLLRMLLRPLAQQIRPYSVSFHSAQYWYRRTIFPVFTLLQTKPWQSIVSVLIQSALIVSMQPAGEMVHRLKSVYVFLFDQTDVTNCVG